MCRYPLGKLLQLRPVQLVLELGLPDQDDLQQLVLVTGKRDSIQAACLE